MSIKGELTKTASYLRSARKAILGRGGEISLTAGLKDLHDAVYTIPADASLAYLTDDSVAYEKIVPTGAEEFARVSKVGGMSYKTRNLITRATRIGEKANGLTFTVQEDNSIVVNGTATATTSFSLQRPHSGEYLELEQGKTYTLSGCPGGGSTDTYRLIVQDINYTQNLLDTGNGYTGIPSKTKYYCFVRISEGYTANNLIFKPMINEGETALPYEKYFEGLRDAKVTALKSVGANLIPLPYKDGTSKEQNGLTYTVNADGSIHVKGTATAVSRFYLNKGIWGDASVWAGGRSVTRGDKTFTDCNYFHNNADLYIEFDSGTTIDEIRYPRVNYGSTALPYSKYKEPITFPISEELRTFLEQYGYGRGIEGYPNYIDYERKVFVQNTYRQAFDGTENWTTNGTKSSLGTYRMSAKLPFAPAYMGNKIIVQCINSHGYISRSAEGTYNGDEGVSFNASSCLIYDTNYDTDDVTAWKAHLAELYANGNPLIVEYALATPIEIDISAYLTNDNFIEVEGGGTITAVNEHGYDTPSTIHYTIKTAGE